MIPLGVLRQQRAGFTLVEMIVAIGIIIVAAGFIAPAVTAMFKDRRIENATAVIITTINEARNARSAINASPATCKLVRR